MMIYILGILLVIVIILVIIFNRCNSKKSCSVGNKQERIEVESFNKDSNEVNVPETQSKILTGSKGLRQEECGQECSI